MSGRPKNPAASSYHARTVILLLRIHFSVDVESGRAYQCAPAVTYMPAICRCDTDDTTRCAYPVEFILNAEISCAVGRQPTDIIMLTCDAFGVLLPVSKLTLELSKLVTTSSPARPQPKPLRRNARRAHVKAQQIWNPCLAWPDKERLGGRAVGGCCIIWFMSRYTV